MCVHTAKTASDCVEPTGNNLLVRRASFQPGRVPLALADADPSESSAPCTDEEPSASAIRAHLRKCRWTVWKPGPVASVGHGGGPGAAVRFGSNFPRQTVLVIRFKSRYAVFKSACERARTGRTSSSRRLAESDRASGFRVEFALAADGPCGRNRLRLPAGESRLRPTNGCSRSRRIRSCIRPGELFGGATRSKVDEPSSTGVTEAAKVDEPSQSESSKRVRRNQESRFHC